MHKYKKNLDAEKKLSYEGKNDKYVTFYRYKSKWPHAGAGKGSVLNL